MNFIYNLFHDKIDESVHRQFIRFGRGEYGRRALLSLWKTPKGIKVKGSFEFANDFVMFIAGLGNITFYGEIWSKDELPGIKGVKKTGKWISSVKDFPGSRIKEISDKASYLLLNADAPGIKLRIKSKLPKPGKDEGKIDDKFCQMELDNKYYSAVKQDFFWDLPECKKTMVEHRYIINEIGMPKTEEKDFARIREMAKRKGKIIRIANTDGKEIKEEKNFEA